MTTKYWIKLYHEVLDDPKTARLPDNLWRRFFEFCLLAGEAGYNDDDPQNGRLPPASDMSWRLRVDEETLTTELDALARKGFIEYRAENVLDGYWFVTKFSDRQRKMGKAEYMRRLREERGGVTPKLQNSYQNVTNGNADKDKDKEIDVDEDREPEKKRGAGSKPQHPVWELPQNLNTPEFEAAWIAWFRHRHENGRYLTQTTGETLLAQLSALGPERATAAILHSIGRGWLNVYENDQPQASGRSAPALVDVAAIFEELGLSHE